jgi:DNA-binding NarL/FixJ family response regulator
VNDLIKVGILEDDEDMRAYLVMLLKQTEDMEVVFDCGTIKSAMKASETNKADLCLVDLQLPDGNGVEFIKKLKSQSDTKALILTILGDKASVLIAFEAGANGYLLKDTPPEQIRRDIRAVIKGANPISPQAATHILSLMQSSKVLPVNNGDDILTAREKDVLIMFSRGLSYKETASTLDISPHTVSDYVKSIYKKLSVHSRSEAIFEAVQNGWLDI